MTTSTATILYAETGRPAAEGLQPEHVCVGAKRLARELAEERQEAFILDDTGEYTAFLPEGDEETFDTWDEAINWVSKNEKPDDLVVNIYKSKGSDNFFYALFIDGEHDHNDELVSTDESEAIEEVRQLRFAKYRQVKVNRVEDI